MTTNLFALALLSVSGPVQRPPYREPAPGTLRRLAQGDFIALVRFVGHGTGLSDVPIRSRGSLTDMSFSVDRYTVVASNQPAAPHVIRCLRPSPPRRSVVLADKSPKESPDMEQIFLLVGRRAVDGTLCGGDFDPRQLALAPNDAFDAESDEVAVEALEPTSAGRLGEGTSPAEIYVATRLISMSGRGDSAGFGDARFFFRAVRELRMIGDRYAGSDYVAPGARAYPTLTQAIGRTVEARFPNATTLDERIFLASTLSAMGLPAGPQLMSRALESALASGEQATGAVVETWDVDTHDDSVPSDHSFVLASRTSNGALRGLLLRRADSLPGTDVGWSALMKLLGEERDESLHRLLQFVADKSGRRDLAPPSLTDANLHGKLAHLVQFWKGKSVQEVRSVEFRKKAPTTSGGHGR